MFSLYVDELIIFSKQFNNNDYELLFISTSKKFSNVSLPKIIAAGVYSTLIIISKMMRACMHTIISAIQVK